MCDGIGTDIVSVARIERLMIERGPSFLEKWFTAQEIGYCLGKAEPGRHFAARFAAKEAVVKALPVRWEGPLPWRSVEIVKDGWGGPRVRLSGTFAATADEAGVTSVLVSLSHCDEYATATALATGGRTRATGGRTRATGGSTRATGGSTGLDGSPDGPR